MRKKTRRKKTRMAREKKGWGEFEELFATEVIAQAQRNARKWFTAWAVTAVALVVSNVLWAVR